MLAEPTGQGRRPLDETTPGGSGLLVGSAFLAKAAMYLVIMYLVIAHRRQPLPQETST
jgi:hypothetical protein